MSGTFNAKDWESKVGQLIAASRLGFGSTGAYKVMRQSVKLMVKAAYELTPPIGNAPNSEGVAVQKKVGFAAVDNDIRKVFMSGGEAVNILSKSNKNAGRHLARLLSERKYAKAMKFLKGAKQERVKVKAHTRGGAQISGYTQNRPLPNFKTGGFYSLSLMSKPTASAHNAKRNGRGRVTASAVVGLVPRAGAIKSYIRLRQKQVGKGKSGWGVAMAKFGLKPAVWTRQSSTQGVASESKSASKMTFTFGNSVSHIQVLGGQLRVMERAVSSQTHNLKERIQAAIQYHAAAGRMT